MGKYKYIGCFFEYESLYGVVKKLRKHPLAIEKTVPHVTFQYKPDFVDTSLFGIPILVTIIGYGSNGENEGLLVELTSDNEQINSMIRQIPVPHITLSVSENGQAVNTRYLDFTLFEKPMQIVGHYGGFSESEISL